MRCCLFFILVFILFSSACRKQEIELEVKNNYFIITYNTNGGSYVSDILINNGDTIKEPPKPKRAYYDFAGWYSNREAKFHFNIVPKENLYISAKWIIQSPFIFIINNMGGSHTIADTQFLERQIPIPYEEKREFHVSKKYGYIFDGFYTDTILYHTKFDFTKNMKSDSTIFVKWRHAKKYSITFKLQNLGTFKNISDSVKYFYENEFPAFLPEPFANTMDTLFVDWRTSANRDIIFKPKKFLTNDTVLYAFWKWIKKYTITFNTNGGSSIADQTSIKEGSTIDMVATPTKGNFVFGGWYYDADFSKAYNNSMPIFGNMTLYAKWKSPPVNSFTITFIKNGATDGPSDFYVPIGSSITAPTTNPTKSDSNFVNWYSDIARTTFVSFPLTLTANTFLYAKFAVKTYSVTFSVSSGTSNAPTNLTAQVKGTSIAAPTAIPTKSDSTFVAWYSDATRTTTATSFAFNLTKDTTLYAKFAVKTYAVTFSVSSGTSNAPTNLTSQAHGTSIDLPTTIPTRSDSTFVAWHSDAARTTTATSFPFNLTKDTTLYAKFAVKTYSVTFSVSSGTSNAPTNLTAQVNGTSIAAPTAIPTKSDSTFVAWYSDAARTTTATTFPFNLTKDTTLYAKFAVKTYNVTFSVSSGTSNAPTNLTSQAHGTSIAAPTATPTRSDSTFVAWYSDAIRTTTVTFPITLTADTILYAKFSLPFYTVTFNSNGGSGGASNVLVLPGETIPTITALPTKSGSALSAWSINNDGTDTAYFFGTTPINRNITLYARWTNAACTGLNYNGHFYAGIQIGTQCWLSENLKDSTHETSGISSCYDELASNCLTYGRLYNWDATMKMDNLISGWHLPNDIEWSTLGSYLGGNSIAGDKMKAGGNSGFNALFAGMQNSGGVANDMGNGGYFWSSTLIGGGNALHSYILRSNSAKTSNSINLHKRLSLRLLKD